jgi:selenide,water dikinase
MDQVMCSILAAPPTRRKPAKVRKMQPRVPIATDLVLLGAGHAHVEVLRRFAIQPEPGVRLTLIAREPETPCAAMLPGLIRGDYTFQQVHIDLAPLAAAASARLFLGEVAAISLPDKRVSVPGRPDVPFDLLSIDVGSGPAVPPGAGQPVKPIGRLLMRLATLEAELRPGARLAVVAGDADGTELALALARRYGEQVRIILVCETAEPLAGAPSLARSAVRAALVDAGVELTCGVRAGAWADGRLALSDGTFLEVEAVLWATAAAGPRFLATSGLACDERGCIRVDQALRSISHGFVFAAGDCAAVPSNAHPTGPALAANLRRAARGRAPWSWRSGWDAPAIVGLGNQRAVAWRSGLAVSGRAVWRWKDWIDRRRIRIYQEPIAPLLASDATRRNATEHPLIGWDTADDAAVIMQPPPGMAVVQSGDHLRAFIDDPFVFGEIAAAHALSDLHAKGTRPWTARAVAFAPHAAGNKTRTELADMLQGVAGVLAGDGCALAAPRTDEAAETALSLVVTGLADPAKLLRRSGLRPGDTLVLTKPLGTGIILAGHRRGLASATWLQAAIASMRVSNAAAAAILREFGVMACTDVKGFGLVGHLLQILQASGVAAVIWPDRLPALPGALELAAHGVESPRAPENRKLLPGVGADARTSLLTDPQTSGGLLAGIVGDRVDACIAALRDAGVAAAIIGAAEQGDAAIRLG